jgi:neuralized-like protein 4
MAQVALQVLIKPDSYKVGPETVGAKSQIDPRFSNDEMEWSTKQRGSVIVYGLLVRVLK